MRQHKREEKRTEIVEKKGKWRERWKRKEKEVAGTSLSLALDGVEFDAALMSFAISGTTK